MYKDIITKLHTYGIALEPGLTAEELTKIEAFYQITFPKELRALLMQAVPVGESFYNWRDFSEENVARIKHMLNIQFEWISEEVDIIYYGANLEDYFDIEFGDKDQSDIDFENLRSIPFWTSITS